MAKKDIEKHQIQKGQVLNPKGRPPKFYTAFIKQVKEGYLEIGQSPPTATEIKEWAKLLLMCPRKKLIEIAKDDNAHVFLASAAKELATGNFKSLMELNYFAYGRPAIAEITTNVNNTTNVNQQIIAVKDDLSNYTDEQLKAIADIYQIYQANRKTDE